MMYGLEAVVLTTRQEAELEVVELKNATIFSWSEQDGPD